MKIKAKVKYIACDIYKRGINIFIGTPKQLIEWAKSTYNEDEDDTAFIESLENCKFGLADFHYGNGYGVVRLPKFPKSPSEIAYMAHELLHATCWMLWYCGVDFDNRFINNEAYTYLHEHLVRNTLEKEGYEDVEEKIVLKFVKHLVNSKFLLTFALANR